MGFKLTTKVLIVYQLEKMSVLLKKLGFFSYIVSHQDIRIEEK